jgi:hypothetical protein
MLSDPRSFFVFQFGIFMELGEPKEAITTNFDENRIELVRNGSIMTTAVIIIAIVVKIVLKAIKKPDGDADVDGYTRYSDSNSASRGSQSKASTKQSKTTKGTKNTMADDGKSTAPSMTSALSDGISEV